jgi:hypothetical protein
MMLGVGAIAFSSATTEEQSCWRLAADREATRYGISSADIAARMQGQAAANDTANSRTGWDWLLISISTGLFAFFASIAHAPQISFHLAPALLLTMATLALLIVCTLTLWRTTRFR